MEFSRSRLAVKFRGFLNIIDPGKPMPSKSLALPFSPGPNVRYRVLQITQPSIRGRFPEERAKSSLVRV
jgi:hypothetical protein